MIDIGQKMCFIPHWNVNQFDNEAAIREKTIVGKIIYVDRAHRKFTVKYTCGGTAQKETFKFSDIGETIHRMDGKRYGS